METSRKYYILVIVFIALFILSICLLIFGLFSQFIFAADMAAAGWIGQSMFIALVSMIITAIGTCSTLILGWRNEKRAVSETKLKIEKLELEIAELKLKKAIQDSAPQD
jgi:hypothetical protein